MRDLAGAWLLLVVGCGNAESPIVDAGVCLSPRIGCAMDCVDPTSDSRNCGSCGATCHSGQACVAGKCVLACPSPQVVCGDACVDPKTDIAHCGGCNKPCPSGEVCSTGKCALSCQSSLTNCSGLCVNTQTDLAHCGGCALPCKSGEVCSMGKCALSCQSGLTNCNGLCVNTHTDLAHCGGCTLPCKSGEVCSTGECVLSCQQGLTSCGGVCVNTQTDQGHCGACDKPCTNGTVCSGGSCGAVCSTPLVTCDSGKSCVDTRFDPGHCGGCTKACPTVAHGLPGCFSSMCGIGACISPYRDCNDTTGDGCEIDTDNDVIHCGGCGTLCSAPNATAKCTLGSCAVATCSGTFLDCNNSFTDGCETDGSVDPLHCGVCKNGCAAASATTRCTAGKCEIVSCTPGFADCDGKAATGCETNTANDLTNCGACGRVCPPAGGMAESCINGACNGLPPIDSALIGYWNLDDVGPQITDLSGNGNHGTIVGATRVDGQVGKAFAFTNGSCISVPKGLSSPTTGVTMLAWVNSAGGCDSQSHGIIMNQPDTVEMGVGCPSYAADSPPSDLSITSFSSNFQSAMTSNNLGTWVWRGSTSLGVNTWRLVVFTWDGTTMRHYVDGAQVDSLAQSALSIKGSGLRIGCRADIGTFGGTAASFFRGIIDEVALYSRALSATEISNYYNNTK